MEVIIENYNLTESEFWKARNIFLIRKLNIIRRIILLTISLTLMWMGSQILDAPAFFFITLLIILIYLCFLMIRLYLIPYMRFKKNVRLNHKQSFSFSSKGINFVIENISMEIKDMETKKNKSEWVLLWDKIQRVYANADLYIFYFNSLFLTIPKRLFKDEEEWNLFKQIVDEYSRIVVQNI